MDDLSQIPTEDLLAFREGRLSDVSTESLMALRGVGAGTPQQQAPQQSDPIGEEKSGDKKPAWWKTILDQGLQGATFGFADEITDRIGAGIASLATGVDYDVLLDEARATTKEELKRQMEERPVLSLASNIVGGVGSGGALLKGGKAAVTAASKAPVVANVLRGGNTAAAAVQGVRGGKTALSVGKGITAGSAAGGAYGAGTADEGERLEGAKSGAKMGALVGGAIPGAAAVGGAVKRTIAPAVDDVIAQTAQLAQKHNIPLGLDQVTGSKAREFLASTSGRVPFSGGKKFVENQQKAFNRAVLKTIGQEGDKFTEDVVEAAYNDIGKKFDDVLAGKNLQINENHAQRLAGIIDDAEGTISGDKVKAVRKTINAFIEDIADDGTISGDKLGDIRSVLTKKIKRADPGVKEYLGDLLDVVVDISTEGDPAARKLLTEARYQYKNLKTLEPLLAKGMSEGNIRPALLKNRVVTNWGAKQVATGKAGELGELARVGDLIKSKIGDSGTAERMAAYYGLYAAPGAAYGAITTEGDMMDKLGGAAAYGAGTVAAARGYQAYNRNPALVNRAINAATTAKLPATAGTAGGYLSKNMRKKNVEAAASEVKEIALSPEQRQGILQKIKSTSLPQNMDDYADDLDNVLPMIDKKVVSRFRKALKDGDVVEFEREIPVSSLVTDQAKVSSKALKEKLAYGDDGPVEVFDLGNGRFFVDDGNHRAALAVLQDQPSIKAIITSVKGSAQ